MQFASKFHTWHRLLYPTTSPLASADADAGRRWVVAITLDFYGGLFVVTDRATEVVEVHFWRPQSVKVQIGGLPDHGLGRLLTLASALDFEGTPTADIHDVPIRPLSDILPVDYQSSVKTVRFTPGEVAGDGPPVTDRALRLFQEAKSATNGDDTLQAFRQLSGISGKAGPRLQTLADEFFAQNEEELKYWQLGYHVTVDFSELHALPSGQTGSSYPLPDDARIVFDTEETSTIPHQPSNNPHVLERPPTRRRRKR
jgi:peptidoglycan hydrolase-like protein with peptidoglycan-binding domain